MRVARGPRLKSLYAPAAGYRYDGLYFVEDYWEDTGKAGFKIWRYRLRRDDPERPSWEPAPMLPEQAEPGRRETTIQRIIRNTAVAMGVKELHGYCCQVCGVSLQVAGGLYAEGAHIRPLGRPHNGPDVAENILCLCPNHHVLFDDGAFGVADDFSLIGIEGRLRTVTGHTPGPTYLAYHREHYLRIEPAA